uniref:Uncharacterized protein n=1 Tax=viral metagenome TaxID=1070528 RepID=A0A6M3IFT7_9ZZZZ
MAATTAIAGYDGSITGPSGCTEVINWNADLTVAQLDATSMGSSGYEEVIEGLKGATFNFTCQGATIPTRGLSAVTLKTKSTGGVTISGSAIIGRVGIADPVNDKVTYTGDAKFTGSVTVA